MRNFLITCAIIGLVIIVIGGVIFFKKHSPISLVAMGIGLAVSIISMMIDSLIESRRSLSIESNLQEED